MLNNLFAYLTVIFTDVKEREEGQGMVEYALILALVSIAAIAVLPGLGAAVTTVFTTVTGSL
ncbi:MAG: Flp family type IVb pilin [Chloroflexota bacterium]|nr:Flp family type IVb pilin [Chloroflexota bacterium]